MKIGLISCTKKKKPYACPAKELYSASPLFRLALSYCQKHYDKNYILSAKHGLIDLDRIIEPYNMTLGGMKRQERMLWAMKTASRLKKKIGKTDILYFHTGKPYREFLIPLMENISEVMLEHSGIGRQLKFYISNISS